MDDLGWRDLVCYGSPFYETPNLDRLAQQSVLFTDAYAACPVCSPTRASILSGKYPATLGVTDWIGGNAHGRLIPAPYIDHLPLAERSLAETLRAAGYATWHVGKWHLGHAPYYPEHHGFEVNIGGCHWGMPHRGYFSPWEIPTLDDGPKGQYLTDRLTDEAVRLILNHDDGRPFFLNLWYYSVHIPIQAKPEDIARFEAKAHAMHLDEIDPFAVGERFPTEHKQDQRVKRRLVQSDPVYAAMVYAVDQNIGRLLRTLDERGLTENTVIIFTSDNGGLATSEGSPTCNAPLSEGKGWMYEGGTREPLLIRWPGRIVPGRRCEEPVTSPDFYPTMLEMAGLDLLPEQHVDGESLVPLLTAATAGTGRSFDREAIYWHYPHYGNQGGTPGCSVRSGDWKLIEFFEDDHLELYNLRTDIGETRNLVRQEPERVRRLHAMMKVWRSRVGAKLPTPNPVFRTLA